MLRLILVHGLIAGAVIIAGIIVTSVLGNHGSVLLGYLIMLVALSSILVGVKSWRDTAGGGVIKFTTALGVGLGIALTASVVYVAIWEAYLAVTHYSFVDHYAAALTQRAATRGPAAIAKAAAEIDQVRKVYANPPLRMAMTFVEIAPVGLLISIVSAALLRNPKFLPARGRPVAATA